MSKEELEKEAEENSFRYTLDKPWACEVERKQIMAHFEKAYLAGAEPREKQIQALGERCLQLQKDKGNLTDKLGESKNQIKILTNSLAEVCEVNKEFEAQIEKMKCCENCNNFMHRIDHRCNTKCKNLSEWEIKEK